MGDANLALSDQPRGGVDWLRRIILLAGFVSLAAPTTVSLAQQTWARDTGEQGLIVLATGIWLLWRQRHDLAQSAKPGATWLTATLLAASLAFYVLGRILDFITLEAGGLYGFGLAIFHDRFGLAGIRRTWFPLLYLAFSVPPPSAVIDAVTAPLKHFVTWAATSVVQPFGIPVDRQGVTIFVAQYQLLVEDACSGMNSLIGLTAVSLLYIYLLRRASPLYASWLTLFVIPVAIISNILRIVVLILLTYGFGDAVAQGFLHFTAGLFLFAAALAMVFGLDALFSALLRRPRAPA